MMTIGKTVNFTPLVYPFSSSYPGLGGPDILSTGKNLPASPGQGKHPVAFWMPIPPQLAIWDKWDQPLFSTFLLDV